MRTQQPYGDAFSIKKNFHSTNEKWNQENKRTKKSSNYPLIIYEIFNLQQKVYHVEIFFFFFSLKSIKALAKLKKKNFWILIYTLLNASNELSFVSSGAIGP